MSLKKEKLIFLNMYQVKCQMINDRSEEIKYVYIYMKAEKRGPILS